MDDLHDSDHEMEESDSSQSHDRLSELPNSLILHILSFLPMREVISTSLLSKRWKNLWATVPSLNFIEDIEDNREKARNFINRALISWEGTKLKKFKIDFDTHFDMSLSGDVDVWLRFARAKKVEELCINLVYNAEALDIDGDLMRGSKKGVYPLLQCLYSCPSIRKLSLVGCNLRIRSSVQWNQLKSLRIDGYCFSERAINKILSGAPRLEVLFLRLMESFENLNIKSSSLRKLRVEKYLHYSDDKPSTDTELRISCPNLESLNVMGVLYSKCSLMNVSSLTEVVLGFVGANYYSNGGFSWKESLGATLKQIFPAIEDVEKVKLSNWCIKVLGMWSVNYWLSPLSGVKILRLDVSFIELDKMVDVLELFPMLEMLVIEHTTDYTLKEVNDQYFREKQFFQKRHVTEPLGFDIAEYIELSETNFTKLRIVKITSFLCDTSIFPMIEFLLRHASKLEKMVIRVRRDTPLPSESLFQAAEKLLSMPRSSPTAKVILCRK